MGAAWGKIPKVALLFRKEFGCLGNLANDLKKNEDPQIPIEFLSKKESNFGV